MLRKLATSLILVLTTSLALVVGASARVMPEPPPGPGAPPNWTKVALNAKLAAFTALGSPTVFIGTRYAGDPAALRAQLVAFGGAGGYATPPAPGSNVHVLGLQP